ncbi:MAG: hypothetical protein R1F52_04215 [Candidatus Nitrosoabyssus spongiisocia]|nr:MAG: hypothetical protein R1F52_04215 [Nitrosopumilaceae archaeon AB1(1)]
MNYTILLGIFACLMTITFVHTDAQEETFTENIVLEKTLLELNVSENNILPWGYIEGKISNPVREYPVIIQIYQNDKPVQFAQVSVNEDNTYEYKFRVLDVNSDRIINIFEGSYTVFIYKVVYATQLNI